MINILEQDGGFVLVTAQVIMLLLIVLGLSAITTSSTGIHISGNERQYNLSFYAAEAARSYVQGSPALYGVTNTIQDQGYNFPDLSSFPATSVSATTSPLGLKQSYYGRSVYQGSSTAKLRGTGFEAGNYKAHVYKMICLGKGPSNTGAESQVEAGFYRIGF